MATYNLLYPAVTVAHNGSALSALQTIDNSVVLRIFATKVNSGDAINVSCYYNNSAGNFRGAGFIAGIVA